MKKGHGRDGHNEDSESYSLLGSHFHTNVILAPHEYRVPQGAAIVDGSRESRCASMQFGLPHCRFMPGP